MFAIAIIFNIILNIIIVLTKRQNFELAFIKLFMK